MKLKKINELMLPLDEYAVVEEEATMIDAIRELDTAQKKLPASRQPHRAVLVINDKGEIVGKLGQLVFLKALEPKYDNIGDIDRLSSSGWSSDFLSSVMDNMRLWKESFADYVRRAENTKIKEVMHPITEYIDIDAPLSEAVHKLVMYQTLSILVKKGDKVVGILRLADVFTEIADKIKIYSES